MGKSLDRKTEIVTEQVVNALEELKKKYGQEIEIHVNASYITGKIAIEVK